MWKNTPEFERGLSFFRRVRSLALLLRRYALCAAKHQNRYTFAREIRMQRLFTEQHMIDETPAHRAHDCTQI